MTKRAFGAIAAAGPVLAALWSLAAVDLSGQGLFGLSEQDEIELGRQAAEEIEKKEPILDDRAVTDYVDRLGQALVARSERPGIAYRFKVVDSAEINAFALPGGYIYVNRGLLEAAGNESELVGVLGHEISHVVARHSAEQIKKLQITGLGLGILGAILGDGKAGQIGNLASQLVATGVFLKYSREAEREADVLGASNVYAAGYDPRGMVTFFDKLAAMRQRQSNAVATFFSSHPDPEERAANVDSVIQSLGSLRGLRLDSREFHSMQYRLSDLPPPAKRADNAGSPDQPPPAAPAPDIGPRPDEAGYRGQESDREIAARFAPVLQVGLGDNPIRDFPTNFNFDGDWLPDNNADNAESPNFRPRAYVYYSVAETTTHFLVHYGLYFPIDDQQTYDRRSLASDNDFEVFLAVIEKATASGASSEDRLALVETHFEGELKPHLPNVGLLGAFGAVPIEDGRPLLAVDPRGHQVTPQSVAGGTPGGARAVIAYRYAGRADEPGQFGRREVGYDLLPMQPLWELARQADDRVFSGVEDLGAARIETAGYRGGARSQTVALGRIGTEFRAGRRWSASRAPWGWAAGGRPAGEWLLDPAASLRERLRLSSEFSTVYLHLPMLGVFR